MNQLNFTVRVRVPLIDSDQTSAHIKQREVMAILRSTLKGAVRKGARDVTLWDSYGQLLAHWDSQDPKQTVAKAFRAPLGK